MKFLVIGFHKYDDNMYPHLRTFIDIASPGNDLTYFHFRERGYFPLSMMRQSTRLRSWAIAAKAIWVSVVDSFKLWRNYRHHDTVIAIDHYIYAVASLIFSKKKIVFWSHDIISHDNAIYRHPFVRAYMRVCSVALVRNGRVIVQDEARLNLLKESLILQEKMLDVMFMPVSLERTGILAREPSSVVRPRLLQSGGIGAYRCSDRLLAHYQDNSSIYRLYFHGFIFPEIWRQLLNCTVQPMVSSRTVKPKYISQISDFCDIGFVCYEDENDMNFFLVSHASGQLVEFLRVGLPVIVMGKNNLKVFVEDQGIGIGIKDMAELNQAIKTIAGDYPRYSKNSLQCFEQNFEIGRYVRQLLGWL